MSLTRRGNNKRVGTVPRPVTRVALEIGEAFLNPLPDLRVVGRDTIRYVHRPTITVLVVLPPGLSQVDPPSLGKHRTRGRHCNCGVEKVSCR